LAAVGAAAVVVGRGDGSGAVAVAAGGREDAGGAVAGSGTMMLTGGVEAAVGKSALVGLPVGAVGGVAASAGAAAAAGAPQDPEYRMIRPSKVFSSILATIWRRSVRERKAAQSDGVQWSRTSSTYAISP